MVYLVTLVSLVTFKWLMVYLVTLVSLLSSEFYMVDGILGDFSEFSD